MTTTMTHRTYKDPGLCVKCGDGAGGIVWVPKVPGRVNSPGHLTAYCGTCGYVWKVRTKDEMR